MCISNKQSFYCLWFVESITVNNIQIALCTTVVFLHHSEVNKFVKILICSMKAQIWSEWQIPFFKSILAAVFFNLSDDSIQTSTILLHLDNSVSAPDGEKH